MKVIYVAGPYRGVSREEEQLNIASAKQVAKYIVRAGCMPITPHLNTCHFDDIVKVDNQFWLDGDLEILRRCDGVFFCIGWANSVGCLKEREAAEHLNLPMFESLTELYDWRERHEH